MNAPLLIEIVCEEIPSRAIPGASAELAGRVASILDAAGLARGEARGLGGPRRLAVRVESVEGELPPREEEVLGPPAGAAFGADGSPTKAAAGFARKHGVDPGTLRRIETERGVYAGFRRVAPGRSLESVLAAALPAAVAGMPFPKTMRWGDGRLRWVRPVHSVLALHGERPLAIELLGIASGPRSLGHRFLGPGPVAVPHPDRYEDALAAAHVVADPSERRRRVEEALEKAAASLGGRVVPDLALLAEVADLVEWPGVVAGSFDAGFLELPREILVTTLRHHQKSFSVEREGGLLPAFLSVANTDRDPAGHIRRGNEWVVGGRLSDARFFWDQDRTRPLASRVEALERVTYHVALGSYAEKARRTVGIASRIAEAVSAPEVARKRAVRATELAKADLATGLVGEFPELQGIVGGLLLAAEGEDPEIARAVYAHYRPAGADDALPDGPVPAIVAVADKLDAIAGLLSAGERPTGSRDPFGLRRAGSGIFRIVHAEGWSLSIDDLAEASGRAEPVRAFLLERLDGFLRDRGYTPNEIAAVLRAGDGTAGGSLPVPDLLARLGAISAVREREDFAHLADLVKRVANIRRKNPELAAEADADPADPGSDPERSVSDLSRALAEATAAMEALAASREYPGIVDLLAGFVEPVDRFFAEALVINPDDARATRRRLTLLAALESALTRHFDLRELPGEADRRR